MSLVVQDNGLRAVRTRCSACRCFQVWAYYPTRDDVAAWRTCFACGKGPLEVVVGPRGVRVANVSAPEELRTGT